MAHIKRERPAAIDALLDYRRRAPGVHIALPTHEHFAPLLVTTGAAEPGIERVTCPITEFAMSTMTKRSVQVG